MSPVFRGTRLPGQTPPPPAAPAVPAPTPEEIREDVDQRRRALLKILGGFLVAAAAGGGAAWRYANLPERNEYAETISELVGDVNLDLGAIQDILEKMKTASPSELEQHLRTLGYIRDDEARGNHLNPKIFPPNYVAKLQSDPLTEYWLQGPNGEETFTFRKSFGDKVVAANNLMAADGKGHLIVTSSFRTNAYQQSLQDKPGVKVKAKIGNSQHEAGLALDVRNWREAEPYFKKVGLTGGFAGVEDDVWHFDQRGGAGLLTQVGRRAEDWLGGIFKK